jgi:O-antigen/teichoic acid export membrane protein
VKAFLFKIFTSGTFKTLSIFAGGNLLVAVIAGLGGLLQARWIAPEVFGEFRKYGILTSYFYIGLVFVHDGLTRQYPYLIGKKRDAEAYQTAAVAKWWYLFLSWIFTVVFAGLTVVALIQSEQNAAIGWAAQIAVVWTVYYGAYLNVMYRTSSDFKQLSYNNIVGAIFSFGLLVLVKFLGYWGLALRLVTSSVFSLVINRHFVPIQITAEWDRKRFVDLAKISLPLSLPGYVSTSLLGATLSYFILEYCGEHGLGIYGIAITIQGFALTFTAALNQIFTVKLTNKFGETEKVSECIKYSITPTLLSVLVASLFALVLCFSIKPFLNILLPKYAEAGLIIQIMALSIPLAAAALPLIIFRSALRYKSFFTYTIVRFITCLLCVVVFPKDLTSIVVASLIAELVSLLIGYLLLFSCKNK